MATLKIKTFSEYNLIDRKDFAEKVLEYLIQKNMAFCFLRDGRLISREDCKAILSK